LQAIIFPLRSDANAEVRILEFVIVYTPSHTSHGQAVVAAGERKSRDPNTIHIGFRTSTPGA
jgi:hypothetical protein